MKTFWLLTTTCLLLAGCSSHPAAHSEAAHTGHTASPYAGETSREIKSVSDDEIQALRQGQGMGLARAAELNGYPGPKHVLELADALDLTDRQEVEMKAQRGAIAVLAANIGEEVIGAEEALDALFVSGGATHDTVDSLTAAIAEARGRLRAAHLKVHIHTKQVLTAEQIDTYNRLRGYTR